MPLPVMRFDFPSLSFDDAPVLRTIRDSLRVSRLGIAMATTGIDIVALALPIFILQIYDRVLPGQSEMTLLALASGLLVALTVDTLMRVLRRNLSSRTAARFEHALRLQSVDVLLSAPLDVIRAQPTSAWVERMGFVSTLRDFEAAQSIEIRIDLVFAALYLAVIAYLGGLLVLVPAALLVLFGAVAFLLGRTMQESFDTHAMAEQARHASLLRVLRGAQTIKALALDNIILRRHERFQERSVQALFHVILQTNVAQGVTIAFAQINTVALLAFGAWRVLNGGMTIGAVAACTLLAGRAIQPVQTAMMIWTNYQNIMLARREATTVLTLPREQESVSAPAELHGRIALQGVTWTPPGAVAPLLDGIDLEITPGSIVALEGASGSGKTALLHMLLGLVRPQGGRVLVDGREMSTVLVEALRRQAALLTRDAAIFRGTVMDNLTNFRDGECVNEAMYVSFLLGADEVIRRLPAGFDQPIGAGDALSTGLRQRIGMIRALATHPKVILFDEADVGLDHDSRQRLLSLLKQLSADAAVVLVSPHADVLALADRRYRLRQGKLIAVAVERRLAPAMEVAA